jgi:hypothetical protein
VGLKRIAADLQTALIKKDIAADIQTAPIGAQQISVV